MTDVVVVGAGHAGLAMAHHLALAGIDHVVLERGRVGESWRTGRWDSFVLNTPGALSLLPGDTEGPGPPDAFWPRDAFAQYLEGYAARLPSEVRTGVTVASIRPLDDGRRWRVEADTSDPIEARAVVVASGIQRVPRVPPFASGLPGDVEQRHALTYRNAAALPSGAVLVVGSAQSGIQVAEDLLDAGRSVYLSTGHVGRIRRRYRGRDSFVRLFGSPWIDQTPAQLPDPAMVRWAQPQISGVGPLGHSVSLQWLAERGVRLLGRTVGAADGRLLLRDDVGRNIAWADQFSATITRQMEAAVASGDPDAGPVEDDPGDVPHPDPLAIHAPEVVDMIDAGISSVIWTTGVAGDSSALPVAAVGLDDRPLHTEGVSPLPGLFYLGLPWMRTRGSGIVAGADRDARFILGRIRATLSAAE